MGGLISQNQRTQRHNMKKSFEIGFKAPRCSLYFRQETVRCTQEVDQNRQTKSDREEQGQKPGYQVGSDSQIELHGEEKAGILNAKIIWHRDKEHKIHSGECTI